MLRMAVGHAQCLDEGCASRGAVAACRHGLGGREPTGLLLFTGASYDHAMILGNIAAAFPGVPLVGATTVGELSMAGASDDSVLLVAFGGAGIACSAGVVRDVAANRDMSGPAIDAVHEALRQLAAPPSLCLVFPDGSKRGVERLSQALADALPADCPVFGALAGRYRTDNEPVRQFFGEQALSKAAPFLLLGGDVPVLSRLSRGWRPVGGRSRVTASKSGVVRRIGERTALEFYRHYLGPHAEPALELPLAVRCDARDDFIIRAPGFYSEDDGSIEFPAGIPEGAVVQLAEANRGEMLADTRGMAEELAAAAAAKQFTPAGVLLFSCATRKEVLGTKLFDEVKRVTAALPPGTPVAGFYGHGEIGAAEPGLPLHLHNGSLVALVLGGERLADALPSRFVDSPCPAGEIEALRREIRSLSRALHRAGDARARLEAQKERSQALMRAINGEINEARLEIQRKNELLRHGLALAEEVQRNLLPRSFPELPGWDIAGTTQYSDATGGDYFDCIGVVDGQIGRCGLVVGDVTGHGVAAALLMTTVRALLRMRTTQPGSLADVFADVNRLLCADVTDTGRFMTLLYLTVDVRGRQLTWVRAGQDPIMRYDPKTGTVTDIADHGGPPLGIIPETEYVTNYDPGLRPGQVALLATDGLWEARSPDGEMYGKKRVRAALRALADKPATAIVDGLLAELHEFLGGGKAEDDVTLVVIKATPTD